MDLVAYGYDVVDKIDVAFYIAYFISVHVIIIYGYFELIKLMRNLFVVNKDITSSCCFNIIYVSSYFVYVISCLDAVSYILV